VLTYSKTLNTIPKYNYNTKTAFCTKEYNYLMPISNDFNDYFLITTAATIDTEIKILDRSYLW